MWKKFMTGLLMAVALVTLTACGSSSTGTASQTATTTQTAATPVKAEQSKTLVVYFSASGTTKGVAETITANTKGTLFEIKPSEPYTSADLNYRDDSSRVVKEHAQPKLRPVYEGDVANWESYDTVYIGYPLWWQQAPHVVYTFVEKHNFNGKKVIPFCTSVSSPLGSSGENLAKAAGTGDWQQGIRFSSGVSKDEILSWLQK